MNQREIAGLRDLSAKIDALARGLGPLDTLGRPETIAAIEELVLIAPTLKQLAEGYDRAGWAGRLLGRIVKWIGVLAGSIAGTWGVWTIFMGDKP